MSSCDETLDTHTHISETLDDWEIYLLFLIILQLHCKQCSSLFLCTRHFLYCRVPILHPEFTALLMCYTDCFYAYGRPRWSCDLSPRSAQQLHCRDRSFELPPRAYIFVPFVCCVFCRWWCLRRAGHLLSGVCLNVCDLETSKEEA